MDSHSRLASTLAAILLLLVRESNAVDTFVGPGVVECSRGTCDFSVGPGLGCSDPCHTSHRDHMYDWSFDDISDVSGDFHLRAGAVNGNSDVCFHRHAEDIDAYYPDQYVTIERGCTARCTGCTFAKTSRIVGPALIRSNGAGRCTEYTTKDNFDCGAALEKASEAWGSFHTVMDNDGTTHNLHGYEGIDTQGRAINIPKGCSLDCSDVTFQLLGRPTQPQAQQQQQKQQQASRWRQFLDRYGLN